MDMRNTAMIGVVIVLSTALFGPGCAATNDAHVSSGSPSVIAISPVTLVGKVSSVTKEGLDLVVLDPSELGGSKSKIASAIVTNRATRYESAAPNQAGELAPQATTKAALKAGDIVTIEASIERSDKGRIIALKVTVSPPPQVLAKAANVDHSRQGVIAGRVTNITDIGFRIIDINGNDIGVLAGASTPTMAGPPEVSPSKADYSAIVVGAQVTILGERQVNGDFKAAQLAVAK